MRAKSNNRKIFTIGQVFIFFVSDVLSAVAVVEAKAPYYLIHHCQKFGTRWRLRVRTKAIMAAKSYKEMYGNKETFSNISIMSLRVFGARLETC